MADPNQLSGQDPYNQIKQQAVNSAQAAGQQGLDAITRRYAAMGNLNSGSYANAEAQNSRDTQSATENALGNIGLGEQAQNIQQNQFGQQLGQQGSEFGQQLGQQASQFAQTLPLQQQSLDLEAKQQGLDAQANDINASLGQQQLSRTGGLFGGGGFLGTGIGGGGGK